MGSLYMYFYEYYYVVLILQALCVFHSIRKGNQQKWIYIIVFLPIIGCIAYIFTEVVKKDDVSNLQTGVVNVVNPGGKVKKLEQKFQFSNTFSNRVALAEAYLANRMNEKVVELVAPALTGVFYDNEAGVRVLIHAYHNLGKFEEVVALAPRISKAMNFSKSETNLFYAWALEKTGKPALAEKEYEAMNHRYSNFEARYNYGCFLIRQDRKDNAATVFLDVLEEANNMSRKEKGSYMAWIKKADEEYARLLAEASK